MFAIFTRPRKTALLFLALLSAMALSACDTTALSGDGPTINTTRPVPVALLVPRGSAQPGDAVLAQSLENAARLAISDLQGVQVDLQIYDTAGDAATAATMAAQAVRNGARIILGPVYAEAANAAGLAVANRNINVLSFSNNPTIAGGNVYVLGPTFGNSAERLTAYAVRQGLGNILIVHGTDFSGQFGRNAIQQAIARNGASLAGTVPYDLSQQGVIDAIPRIRSAADGAGARAIFLTATTAGALPLITQLLRESGGANDATQLIGLTRWDIPVQTLELPGVQGGWFALPDPVMAQRFRTRYQTAYGAPPHPIGGLAYDGIAAIGALVGAGKSNALTGAALTQSAGFQGVGGIFRLRPDGTNERGLAVATIENRQVVVIDPAPSSFVGAGF